MFKVGDIIRIKYTDNKYWRIIKKSKTSGHYFIGILNKEDYTRRGVWDDNMINCNREIKLKKICSILETK